MGSEEKKDVLVKPFKTITGLELANSAPEIYHGLVDDLLLDVGVSMLCGKPKTGKSTLARQLAVAVAEGHQFLGKPTMCADVLYLILEGPKGVVQQHLKKLGCTEERGTIHVVHEQMPHRGELGLQCLEATLKMLPKVKLVIVDPVSKLQLHVHVRENPMSTEGERGIAPLSSLYDLNFAVSTPRLVTHDGEYMCSVGDSINAPEWNNSDAAKHPIGTFELQGEWNVLEIRASSRNATWQGAIVLHSNGDWEEFLTGWIDSGNGNEALRVEETRKNNITTRTLKQPLSLTREELIKYGVPFAERLEPGEEFCQGQTTP